MPVVYLSFVEILQKLIKGIMDEILTPVLNVVLKLIFTTVGQFIKDIIADLFLSLFVNLLKIVDFLEDIFEIFSGCRYVLYNGHKAYLLDLLLDYDPVKKGFLVITLMSVGIAFLFTIYATAKSIGDMTTDDKNPVGKILGRALKTAVTFMLVPFMVLILLQLSTIVVVQISYYLRDSAGVAPSIGTIIFLTGSLGAAKNSAFNTNPSFQDALRIKYYNGTYSYSNLSQVKSDFAPAKFDMIICAVCTLLLILILIGGIFLFIRRIFEVLVLYVVAPLFVSVMPLDDGAMFKKWRDLFVAKLFSGFGVVFTMQVFLMFIPFLTGDRLILYSSPVVTSFGVNEGYMINSLLKLFIIIGGAWAAFQSQHLILQILHPEAAMAAQQSTGFMVGLAMGAATGGASMIKGAAGKAGGMMKSKMGGKKGGAKGGSGGASGGDSGGDSSNDPQRFKGK